MSKLHRFVSKENGPSIGVPDGSLELEKYKNDDSLLYLGFYNQYYLIDSKNSLNIYIEKDIRLGTKPFTLNDTFERNPYFGNVLEWVSFTSNGNGFVLEKSELQELVNSMENGDRLIILKGHCGMSSDICKCEKE